jgi:hypothetical protein
LRKSRLLVKKIRASPTRRFEFQKRRQLLIRSCNETLSVVAMCVCNPDRSPFAIHSKNMTNDKSEQDFKPPATPKNQAPDQAQLYRNIQAIQKDKQQRTVVPVGKNPQDEFAQPGPSAHPI